MIEIWGNHVFLGKMKDFNPQKKLELFVPRQFSNPSYSVFALKKVIYIGASFANAKKKYLPPIICDGDVADANR